MDDALQAKIERERVSYVSRLDDALREIVVRLARKPEVRQIILFGSYAEGRRDLFTDLDLIVVMESDQDFVARTAALHSELAPPVDMDLLAYTPEEFEKLRPRGFVRRALESGKVLLAR